MGLGIRSTKSISIRLLGNRKEMPRMPQAEKCHGLSVG
jgi:hypothetical protein